MRHDPIKNDLGAFFSRSTFLRRVFYHLLDLVLLRAWYVRFELRRWAKKAPEKVHMLDAGAGFGQYTYFMSRLHKDWNILAIDKEFIISDGNIFFRKIGKDQVLFRIGDLREFCEKDAFDLVLAADILVQVEDDDRVLRNIHASLKEGGMLLVSTLSDKTEMKWVRKSQRLTDEANVRDGYDIDHIQEKLRNAGFSRVRARYSYGKLGMLSGLFSVTIPIFLLNLTKAFFVILPFYYLVVYPFCFVLNLLDTRVPHRSGAGLIVKAYK